MKVPGKPDSDGLFAKARNSCCAEASIALYLDWVSELWDS
jgi:hypothetical protein